MAQRIVTMLVSDLSGDEMQAGSGETITFSYRGVDYTIDLTDKEAKGFDKSIAMYLEHATRVGGGRAKRSAPVATSGRSSQELSNIRAWARANGHPVSERGRLKAEVIEAYQAAQGG